MQLILFLVLALALYVHAGGLTSLEFPPQKRSVKSIEDCNGQKLCQEGQTCCNGPNGEYGCCPFPSACCCPDQHHCCKDSSTEKCQCTGTCPGPMCTCTDCESGGKGQCE